LPVTATYTVTPTTASCTGPPFTITATINPTATANAGTPKTVCAGSPSILLAGTIGGAATSATWSGGAGTFTPDNTALNAVYTPSAAEIAAGTITLTLTTNDPDGAGPCPAAASSVTITIGQAPSLTFLPTNIACYGDATGSVDLTVTGGVSPYSYSWTASGGGIVPPAQINTEDLTGLVAGTYTVTATGNNGCTSTASVTINQPTTALQASATATGTQCAESSTGNITLTVTGGTSGYTYTWTASNGGTIPVGQTNSQNLISLVAGTYTVTVTDAGGCTVTTSAIVDVANNTPPVINTCPPAIDFNGCTTAAITGLTYSSTPVNITAIDFTNAGGDATDNCAVTSWSYADTQSGACPLIVTRTFTLGDASGLITACQQQITITDNVAPTWTTAANDLDRIVACNDATALANAEALFPIATDNCDTDVSNIFKNSCSFV